MKPPIWSTTCSSCSKPRGVRSPTSNGNYRHATHSRPPKAPAPLPTARIAPPGRKGRRPVQQPATRRGPCRSDRRRTGGQVHTGIRPFRKNAEGADFLLGGPVARRFTPAAGRPTSPPTCSRSPPAACRPRGAPNCPWGRKTFRRAPPSPPASPQAARCRASGVPAPTSLR